MYGIQNSLQLYTGHSPTVCIKRWTFKLGKYSISKIQPRQTQPFLEKDPIGDYQVVAFSTYTVLKPLACAPHLSVRAGWQRSRWTWSWQTEDSAANWSCWCNSLFLSACVCAHSYQTHRTHAVMFSVFQHKGVSLHTQLSCLFQNGLLINIERNSASSLTRVSGVFTFGMLPVTSVSQAKVSSAGQDWISSLLRMRRKLCLWGPENLDLRFMQQMVSVIMA